MYLSAGSMDHNLSCCTHLFPPKKRRLSKSITFPSSAAISGLRSRPISSQSIAIWRPLHPFTPSLLFASTSASSSSLGVSYYSYWTSALYLICAPFVTLSVACAPSVEESAVEGCRYKDLLVWRAVTVMMLMILWPSKSLHHRGQLLWRRSILVLPTV